MQHVVWETSFNANIEHEIDLGRQEDQLTEEVNFEEVAAILTTLGLSRIASPELLNNCKAAAVQKNKIVKKTGRGKILEVISSDESDDSHKIVSDHSSDGV
ncbi:hypothetical protein Trydic_g6180 [Trypoxylus dichotomus]